MCDPGQEEGGREGGRDDDWYKQLWTFFPLLIQPDVNIGLAHRAHNITTNKHVRWSYSIFIRKSEIGSTFETQKKQHKQRMETRCGPHTPQPQWAHQVVHNQQYLAVPPRHGMWLVFIHRGKLWLGSVEVTAQPFKLSAHQVVLRPTTKVLHMCMHT